MSSVADLYLQKLLDQASPPFMANDNQAFKLAHAEGACAVFRDLRMITGAEDFEWRKKFRANYSNQLAYLRKLAGKEQEIAPSPPITQ